MRICVTALGDKLDSDVDPRFGRCRYFIIVDNETFEFEAIENPNIDGMGGIGIQSAQLIARENVKVVITGNVGPNAFRTLQAAGVDIFTGASGSVKEQIEKYNKGEFKRTETPSVDPRFGMRGN
jgi:predicted Fe-Mo cluster-binding NifX family protein